MKYNCCERAQAAFDVIRVHTYIHGQACKCRYRLERYSTYVFYTIINLWTGAKRCSCMHACDWMHCIHDKHAFVCTGVNCMRDLYNNIIITIYI